MVKKINKECKYCGENNIEKLLSFKRKKDNIKCIQRLCISCKSKMSRERQQGKKLSEETKQKLREINLGKKQSQETIDKRRAKLRIPCSEDKKAKLRIAVPGFKHTIEAREKMRLVKTGLKQSQETINKRVLKNTGNKHPPRPKGFSEKMSKIMKKAMDNPITKEKNRQHFYNCIRNTELGKPTSIEIKIMDILDKNNISYIRNEFIDDIDHGFAADFLIPDKRIVIEADGDFWHDYPNGNEIDHVRTKELEENNYKVLRFWERDINNNIEDIEKQILSEILIEV